MDHWACVSKYLNVQESLLLFSCNKEFVEYGKQVLAYKYGLKAQDVSRFYYGFKHYIHWFKIRKRKERPILLF